MRSYRVRLTGAILSLGVIVMLLSACAPGSPSATTNVANGQPLNPNGPTATAGAKGLAVTMSVTPGGPYFLSELISVTVSLANHSQSPVTLDGPPGAGPCGSALYFNATGGSAPHYQLPTTAVHSCPAFIGGTPVKSGQTLTIRQWFPLTDSGAVMLTSGARFLTTTIQQGIRETTTAPDPLAGHWPIVHLDVNSHIPSYRTILLRRAGSLVYVTAPPAARSHLLYMFNVGCYDKNDSGSTWTGNFAWDPVPNGVVHQPGCPGVRPRWSVSVSAPGYAIVSGTYQ